MSSQRFPAELRFLDQCSDADALHRSAWFLLSPFSANQWRCRFGELELFLDFSVKFSGSTLTDPAHRALLDVIKSWVCVQAHPQTECGGLTGPREMRYRVA